MEPTHHRTGGRRCAFSLPEIALVLAICGVTALVLAPVVSRVFVRARPRSRSAGASNVKQLALAMLSYTQDYDEKFPPVSGVVRVPGSAAPVEVSWGPGRKVESGLTAPGLLAPYVGPPEVFLGEPYVERGPLGIRRVTYRVKTLGFLYNDLLATEPHARLPGVAHTILAAEAEDQYWNAGHAWLPGQGPYGSRTNRNGKCDPGQGATVRDAPLRRSGGANYAFSDGHVKWFKGAPSERHPRGEIYFPARGNAAVAADPGRGEPVPGGNMKGYAATFHIL